ncbi:MAG: C39 family peptidase [Chloroflexi bacterium]|nr:C39 family peptidase [Chloroflexota bacterium]
MTRRIGVVLILSLLASVPPTQAEAGAFTVSRFFPQTGFFLRNQDGVNFLAEFNRLGKVEALGYPTSRPFEKGGFAHQALQRAILQWRPELGRAVLANVMDELYYLGKDDWLLDRGVPRHFTGDDGSRGDFESAKAMRLSWLTDPAISQAYYDNPDPLNFYGLPSSRPESFGPFITQRFQRGVLQLWVEAVLGMPRPGAVVGALAGELAKEAGLVPELATQQETVLGGASAEVLLPVPAFMQQRALSCESSAAAMIAAYFRVPLTERQIIAELPWDPNPHKGFRGNIDGWFGGINDYGVYAEPIADVLTNHGLKADVYYDFSLDMLKSALSEGKLVISWITAGTAWSTPVTVQIGGEPVVLVPYEHAVAVKGYDAVGVSVNDPGTGGSARYSNEAFLRASGYFGGMAVVVSAG